LTHLSTLLNAGCGRVAAPEFCNGSFTHFLHWLP